MSEELYNLMDWQKIEALVYSEENEPQKTLKPKMMKNGILFQCFFPEARKVKLLFGKKKREYKMEMQDEAGFFACLIPEKQMSNYTYQVFFENGEEKQVQDPYYFEGQITEEEEKKFRAGICYDIYEKLGAHYQKIKGVWGVHFAVWAPNALRVSVVGDFNHWDGRVHQMNRLPLSGIFELFIPGVKPSDLYKYEIKTKDLRVFLKADPYANQAEARPCNASVVADLSDYQWEDSLWMKKRGKLQEEDKPLSVYEVHLGSWKKPDDGREFYNYRELAKLLCDYVKEMGYTHVELLPVMEHPLDESWGYQVTGYYAPTSRYGTPEDFAWMINYLHRNGIGVIMDWVPAHFPKDEHGLAEFDGTATYEYADPRKGEHPDWGTKIFDLGKNEVRNFLIANALFWVEHFHIDGLRVDAVASMLYLDYGKKDGQWIANKYGGNENLEAIEFFKHLNTLILGRNKGTMMIAEESTAWPKVTGDVEKENGLGFTFKWNMGWMHDFLEYMKLDPYFRKFNHNKMTFSMTYAFSEAYILVLSHDEVVHLKCSMINKMPGEYDDKFENLKAGYSFMMGHPGKKLLFMGQEFGQFQEWSEARELDWYLLREARHQQLQDYVRDLQMMYKKYPALYADANGYDGFQWINADDADRSIYSFIRWSPTKRNNLLFVCNFTPVERKDYWVGVPQKKQCKLILSSADPAYGGQHHVDNPVFKPVKGECDGQPYHVAYPLAPYEVAIFAFN